MSMSKASSSIGRRVLPPDPAAGALSPEGLHEHAVIPDDRNAASGRNF
jgi:hypothetical protein